MPTPKMYTLNHPDGDSFEVSGRTLAMVSVYREKHAAEDRTAGTGCEDDLNTWDADFVKVDKKTLFELILAAHCLGIKNLLDLTCQTVADMIKGKTPEEIRKTFELEDLPPEEEEKIRRENQWAFE